MQFIKTNKKIIIVALASLVLGLILGSCFDKGGRYHGKMKMRDDRGGHMMYGKPGMMNGDKMGMASMTPGMMMGADGKVDFDKAFLTGMIMHHQGAVYMSEAILKTTQKQELKDLATKIIADQQKEISQMEAWQKEWYK